MKKKIGVYLWKAFILIMFLAFSALALFFAYGYQYDFKKRDFSKTSIIDITAREKDVSVTLDGTQQAEETPFQVKSVLPGKHLLAVNKENFQPWSRKVEVEEDLVTIVDDVLLVPSDVEEMVKPLVDFPGMEGRIYMADNYFAEINTGGKMLKLTSLYGDGTYKSEEIELFKEGIKTIEPMTGENFLLYFDDGGVSWVNFRDKRFVFFKLPEGADMLKIGSVREMIYFLKEGSLYGVPFGKAGEMPGDFEKYLIVNKVEAYVPVEGGDLYFISGGMLFKSDFQGREKLLVDYAPEFFKNIDFLKGNEYGALILRDREEKRHLVLIDKIKGFTYLTGDLIGRPRFNGYDQLLYGLQSGEVFFYDPQLDKKRLVKRFEGDFELLGWFSDRGHFLVNNGGTVELGDVFDANTYILLKDVKDISHYFVLKGSLFFISEKSLNVLSWKEEK